MSGKVLFNEVLDAFFGSKTPFRKWKSTITRMERGLEKFLKASLSDYTGVEEKKEGRGGSLWLFLLDKEERVRILLNLSTIMSETLREALNDKEMFFLGAASLIRDLGYLRSEEMDEEVPISDKKAEAYLIENHHVRTEKYFKRMGPLLGLTEEETNIIGRIARGHRGEDLYDSTLYPRSVEVGGKKVNVAFLASLLRLADAGELLIPLSAEKERSKTKYIPHILEHIKLRENIAQKEWEALSEAEGPMVHPNDPTRLYIKCACSSPKVHRALKRLESAANRYLEASGDLLEERHLRKHLPKSFEVVIEAKGYKPFDFRFTLQENEIVNLLMGERLYKRKEESIRELLKNSVDACRLRREIERKKKKSTSSTASSRGYTPQITISLSASRNRLTIEDNGLGMDEDIVERYFTRIGKSFYRSQDFIEKGVEITPVGELGIGILSCFMLANRISVETKSKEGEPLLVEIDDLSDYFFVQKGGRKKIGTKVTLYLKSGIAESIELEKEVKEYARHLEIPITVVEGGKRVVVKDRGFKPTIEDLFPRTLIDMYGLHYRTIQLKEEKVEGTIGLLFETRKETGPWPTRIGKYVPSGEVRDITFLSNEGIYVGPISLLPPYYSVHADLNVKKNAVDLNIPRNDVVNNQKLHIFREELEKLFLQGLASMMAWVKRSSFSAGGKMKDEAAVSEEFFRSYLDIPALREILKNYQAPSGGIAKRFSSPSSFSTASNGIHPSKTFWDFVRRHFYFKCLTKGEIEYIRYDRIKTALKKQRKIEMISGIERYDNAHLRQIFSNCSGFDKKRLYLLSTDLSELFAGTIFSDITFRHVQDYIKKETVGDMREFFPMGWQVVRFRNFSTNRFTDFWDFNTVYVNASHPLVEFLLEKKDEIPEEEKTKFRHLFRALEYGMKRDPHDIRSRLEGILKRLAEKGLMKTWHVSRYMLRKEDVPPHILRDG